MDSRINIAKTLDNSRAVSREKGEIIHDLIKQSILENKIVILDFENLTELTTAFLNVAIGHLYNDFNSEILNKNLKLINTTPLDKYLIRETLKVVKMKNKSNFNSFLEEEFEDGSY